MLKSLTSLGEVEVFVTETPLEQASAMAFKGL